MVGKYPGFLKRKFGSTTWGETVVMCGISLPVHEAFVRLEDLNHESSLALRTWSRKPLVERRSEFKDWYQAIAREIADRRGQEKGKGSPLSGAGKKGKGKGTKRQSQFRNWSDQQLRDQLAHVGKQMDDLTYRLQEGKLMSGTVLARPYRILPMFVGVLITGFGDNSWITLGSCFHCGNPNETARCCRCQCGICEEHGSLLARASQLDGIGDWQGTSTACCNTSNGCEDRQKQVLEFWRIKTGEKLD